MNFDLSSTQIDPESLKLVSEKNANALTALVVGRKPSALVIAVVDPTDELLSACEEIRGASVVVSCWLLLIVAPAWRCYGRLWEKLSAAFLTLFILGTLLGIGAGIGLAVVWSYDQYA